MTAATVKITSRALTSCCFNSLIQPYRDTIPQIS